MPRKNRIISSSKIYHIVSRGNEKKPIFLDTGDYNHFINILGKKQGDKLFAIYAYCLMPNHYHLLLNEGENRISSIMSAINTTYAIYFNKKYNRVGHLFQGRFKSEAIEDESYFLTATRYIHNNPVSANLVDDIAQYPWSSYRSYLQDGPDKLVDRRFLLNILSPLQKDAISEFVYFSKQVDEPIFDQHLGEYEKDLTSLATKAKIFINRYLQERNLSSEQLKQKSNVTIRNELIGLLVNRSGLTVRQVGELLNLSKSTVSRVR
ncbi:MAG: transposase [Firmicutes bacterium]|nr:transposase [Bacillota bacterium]